MFMQKTQSSWVAVKDAESTPEANQMKKIMEMQIYSLYRKKRSDEGCRYVYQANQNTRLFLLTSITVGSNALSEVAVIDLFHG